MSDRAFIAAFLVAATAALMLGYCIHGARRTARTHQRPRRRPTPPPGHPETIPTTPTPAFDRIARRLWRDLEFRELICPRPNSLIRYPSAAAASAALAEVPAEDRAELCVRRCVCLAWHIRVRPGALQ